MFVLVTTPESRNVPRMSEPPPFHHATESKVNVRYCPRQAVTCCKVWRIVWLTSIVLTEIFVPVTVICR
eukprot:SAG11_NODE_19643_length_462_cov_0.848485_1_plen_68_part_10